MNYQHKLIALAVAASFSCAGAFAMTKDEYKASHERIEADYKAAKKSCGAMKANAKDICVSEAKGTERVAMANLEAQYKPSDKNNYKVNEAKADAAYDTAKEKCDDLAGNAKDVCVKDAKAAHVKAKADAKVVKVSNEATTSKAEKVAGARNDAAKDTNEANYKAAKERCDTFAGDVKDRCIAETKVKYGQK